MSAADLPEPNQTFIDDLSRGIAQDERLPDVVRNRLLRNGFMRVGGGLLSADRLVERQQIESVSDGRVNLNVTKDDLIKR